MKKQRILIVDDDAEITSMLTAFFESQGYECDTAADGISAPVKMSSFKPDLVILDFMMPGADGGLVFERMGFNIMTEKIPVIFLSALSEKEVASKLKLSPLLAIMKKPVELAQLLLQVRELIGTGTPPPKGAPPDDDDRPREKTILDLDS